MALMMKTTNRTVSSQLIQSAPGDQHHAAQDLCDEFRAVADTDQVVCNANQVEQQNRTESEAERTRIAREQIDERLVAHRNVDAAEKDYREEDNRYERDTPQARNRPVVNLALVDLVEQVPTERYQQYLRYQDTRTQHADPQYQKTVQYPKGHRRLIYFTTIISKP